MPFMGGVNEASECLSSLHSSAVYCVELKTCCFFCLMLHAKNRWGVEPGNEGTLVRREVNEVS